MRFQLTAFLLGAGVLSAQNGGQHTVTGVLLDAGCPALASSQSPVAESGMPRTTTAGPAHASATGTTGAATETAVTTRAADRVAATESNEVTHAGRQTSTSGLNNQPGVGSTSGATAASAVGTTGAAAQTTPGERHRIAEPERYADCGVGATTSSYAILSSDGRVYRLDDKAHSRIRKMGGREGFSGRTDVQAVGTLQGDRLTVKSVQRHRASHP